ncbi:MAG: N-acetylmuramoyl-L-alanine amidase [Armatimonadota bacterium]
MSKRNVIVIISLLIVTMATAVNAADIVNIRLYHDGELTAVPRYVPVGMSPMEAAIRLLIDGPNELEAAARYETAIPAGVKIQKLSIMQDAVSIDLSSEIVGTLSEASLKYIFDQFRSTIGDFEWINSIQLTCNGRPLSSYLPSAPNVGAPPAAVYRKSGVGLGGRKICIGPSHGRFWNGGGWYWQRAITCGWGEDILEDTNSIRLTQFLSQYLTQDGATVTSVRQLNESDCCHPETGYPWWKMCAQSWLRHAGAPGSVWASYTGNTGGDTAVDRSSDDIRARPLWADYNGADIYVACHTNAGGGGTANGTETYRDSQMEKPAHVANSLNLATAIQNNVVDAIRSIYPGESGWASRGVKDSAGGFGEIRIPNRPAVLIELAFHDNCSRDASYLVDDFFRSVAEWGLYKGICAYFGNTPTWDKYSCEYVSDNIPSSMVAGQSYNVSVTLRNRGVMWFTSRGFKLGAVGDSDPFASFGRVSISGGVRPGATYTFNYILTAPAIPGTYTTEWRMVRDGYAWFGPTVSKSIAVSGSGGGVVDPPEETGVSTPGFTYNWEGRPSHNGFAAEGEELYIYEHLVDCTARGFNATWNPGFTWSGRGHVVTDFYVGPHGTSRVKINTRRTNGNVGNWYTWLDECPAPVGMNNILNASTADLADFNGVYVDADKSEGRQSGNCNPDCGYRATSIGKVKQYGARWQYINDWVCLGAYSSSSVSDTANRNFAWGEAGLYLYPAVDTSHGNTIATGLGLSGKTPGRVSTGDCNNANILDFKGNASAYGADNADAYAFAWVYAPNGAGPKFDIGSDDGNRVWVNGTLINDNNSLRGLIRDQDVTGGIGFNKGWNRVLFKVHNGTGGFSGTISLRNGGDNRWNEPSVNTFTVNGVKTYGLGYEQDAWYPRIDVANFCGLSNPQPGDGVFTNNTTVTASGTAVQGGPVPLWKQMHFEWGYGISGGTNYTDVTSSGTTWSHSQANVTGHRRFHFFSVSRSGRTSFQDSGKTGGWRWSDGGPANYMDVYVDNLAPQTPSFANAAASGANAISLSWNLPLDRGVNIADGATESYDKTEGGSNHYRAGNVGVQVRRNGTAIYGWGTDTSKQDSGLDSNTQYTYDIAARDNTNQSRGNWNNSTAYAGTVSVYTLAEAPQAGVNINVPAAGTYAMAAWPNITSNSFGASGNHKITKFMYKWSSSDSDFIGENQGTAWSSGTLTDLPATSGTYYLYVRSYNAAGVGNGSVAFGPYELLTDVDAPTVSAQLSASAVGEAPNYNFLKGTVTITALAEDADSGVKKVECRIDSGAFVGMQLVDGSYVAEFDIDESWPNGPHSVTVRATDNAENYADAVKNFTVNKNEVSGVIGLEETLGAPIYRTVKFVLTYDNNGTDAKITRTITPRFITGKAGYWFTDIPDGVKAISAKTAWHLRRRILVSPVNGQAEANFTGTHELLGGDLATPGQPLGDNVINALDYASLRGAWGYGEAGDINGDGVTDNSDYLIMQRNLYRKGDVE